MSVFHIEQIAEAYNENTYSLREKWFAELLLLRGQMTMEPTEQIIKEYHAILMNLCELYDLNTAHVLELIVLGEQMYAEQQL